MEKDIEILKRITVTSFNTNNIYDDVEKVNTAIENLINRVKELEEDNKHQWEERCKMAIELDNDVITKSKIKAKMEEISGMLEVGNIEREIYNRGEYAIEILQELLEEQEDK